MMHVVFAEWNKGELDSYLFEITRDILGVKDEETGKHVVDVILDTAGQKGTGKWTAVAALDQGMPLTLIGEAVFARCLSASRKSASPRQGCWRDVGQSIRADTAQLIDDLRQALYAARCQYAQGLQHAALAMWKTVGLNSAKSP